MTLFEKHTTSRSKAPFVLDLTPLPAEKIASRRSLLRSLYISYLNGVIALSVLALGITVRAMTLGFENDKELLHISVYVGSCIGLFSGASINGDRFTRIKMAIIGIIVCIAASLGASMLVTLFLGYTAAWISSINILASALASMWLLTYCDDNIKQLGQIQSVGQNQLTYMIKAAEHFDSLKRYLNRVHQQGRKPVMGEYWMFRDWIHERANASVNRRTF